jgi:hypothetical protein
MTQTTAANLAAAAAAAQEQASSEQVEALVAGAANTVVDRDQPAGQTRR